VLLAGVVCGAPLFLTAAALWGNAVRQADGYRGEGRARAVRSVSLRISRSPHENFSVVLWSPRRHLEVAQLEMQKMNAHSKKIAAIDGVEAELNYLSASGARPRTFTYDPPPGVPRSTIVNEPHVVQIHNARRSASEFALDTHGFGWVRHRSAVGNFYDEEEIKRVYYPEAEELLKEVTGADRVFVFDHTVRRRLLGSEDRQQNAPRQPVPRVHVDHTARSGPQRVRDLFPNEAEKLLRGRVQIVNLWRPIRGPLRDAPLAVCDARSIKMEQLVPSDLIYRDRVGETYSVTFDPAHQWFYVPEMQADEGLLLKCYDSMTDGRARFAPHSAFTDPTTPPDAAPRESIELRTLIFHAA
jgi:hypothetical protein